jgi:multisubunit Na+/H+ antiporter MnhC subunit
MPNESPAGENNTPDLVNTWKPVTDLYQDTAAPPAPAPPPVPVAGQPSAQPAKIFQERNLPIPIAIVGGIYALRAAMFLLFASIVASNPSSDFAVLLIGHSRSLIPFQVHEVNGQVPADLLAQAMVVTAIVSIVVSVMWFVRYWRIRWITMFYAGVSLFRTLLYFASDKAAGLSTQLAPDQKQALSLACAINLFILCYLAFYPGVAQAFEKKF